MHGNSLIKFLLEVRWSFIREFLCKMEAWSIYEGIPWKNWRGNILLKICFKFIFKKPSQLVLHVLCLLIMSEWVQKKFSDAQNKKKQRSAPGPLGDFYQQLPDFLLYFLFLLSLSFLLIISFFWFSRLFFSFSLLSAFLSSF